MKRELWTLPDYSRVKMSEGTTVRGILRKEFNLLFREGLHCVCTTNDGEQFKLPMETEVELVSTMKEYDLEQLNSNN